MYNEFLFFYKKIKDITLIFCIIKLFYLIFPIFYEGKDGDIFHICKSSLGKVTEKVMSAHIFLGF